MASEQALKRQRRLLPRGYALGLVTPCRSCMPDILQAARGERRLMVLSGIVQVKAGITPEIVEAMTKHSSTLSKMRKKRQVSETLATPDEIATLDLEGTYPLHKTTQASHRVTCQLLDTWKGLDRQQWADCPVCREAFWRWTSSLELSTWCSLLAWTTQGRSLTWKPTESWPASLATRRRSQVPSRAGRPARTQHVPQSRDIKQSSQTCHPRSAQFRPSALTCWSLTADIKLLGRQDLVVTTSADKTARLWKQDEGAAFACAAVLKDHGSDVSAATVHVTGDYFVTASLDKTWCFYDVATATCLQQVCCAQLHPNQYPPQAEHLA